MMRHTLVLLIASLGPTAVAAPQGDKPLQIFMHWDMEGASGLFTREQVWYWEEGVRPQMAQEGRDLLIADINSAARAALDAGAGQLILCDTHHGGGNIILDRMLADPRIRYLERSVGLEDGKRRWMFTSMPWARGGPGRRRSLPTLSAALVCLWIIAPRPWRRRATC